MHNDLSRRVNYQNLKANLLHNEVPRGRIYDKENLKPLMEVVQMVEVFGDHDVHLTAQILLDLADATVRSSQDRSPRMGFYHHMRKIGQYHLEQAGKAAGKGIRHEPISTDNIITKPTNPD